MICKITIIYFSFSYGISTFETNLIMDRICQVNLKYDSSVCENIDDHLAEKEQIQIITTDISTYKYVALTVPAVLACLYMGKY